METSWARETRLGPRDSVDGGYLGATERADGAELLVERASVHVKQDTVDPGGERGLAGVPRKLDHRGGSKGPPATAETVGKAAPENAFPDDEYKPSLSISKWYRSTPALRRGHLTSGETVP